MSNLHSHSGSASGSAAPVAVAVSHPRRGSLTRSIRFAGGVNSLDRFASSYTRAQSFLAIDTPRSLLAAGGSVRTRDSGPAIALLHRDHHDPDGIDECPAEDIANDDDDDDNYDDSNDNNTTTNDAVYHAPDFRYDDDAAPLIDASESGFLLGRQHTVKDSVLASTSNKLVVVDQASGTDVVVAIVPGRSTAPQTVFNSVNVLIGIGLLSLPLAFSYAGWLIATLFVVAAASITLYTAKVLTRCLDTDPSLVTYADIAYAAFGARARLLTSVLFSVELLGSCVALVVLFADSIHALLPPTAAAAAADNSLLLSKPALKIVAFFLLTPLSFLPLSVLSFTSILGILSTFGLVLIVFVDGLVKTTQPGSLWHPMPSSILPTNWRAVPLSLGLLMAPWCGHSVFPNVYRDMRHPYKFKRCLNLSYIFTFLVDLCMAVLGLLMFGNQYVTDEITNNILDTPGYPRSLNIAIIVLIAFIPLSKTPLNARPIITTIEALLGVVSGAPAPVQLDNGNTTALYLTQLRSPAAARAAIRILTNLLFVVIAIVFPSFDRIMALVGSALGFTICIVLPLAFYLKIFGPGRLKPAYYISPSGQRHTGTGHELSRAEVAFDVFAIAVGALLAVVGGVWALLPDDFIFANR
ncbi:transmembrane amino acid transporter protein-domain-containing protein [Lipomyces orientalis]|uniref:Transmembrane amino acid transporter protein-domain-containing protein n=1 Tax=Lipomyces orientalis TaxID=1233043 RepID=A0ACC3TVG6_9ASCO